ncbi:MAG: 1-acyl-sn-glycerol-3-phosphate acyltransferase [Myxococcaceae bacterium]|nr:1-acyl-sn-glycerol-3-phosphate acyltransferase [Myxococcaceae bacterium]
MSTPEPAAPPLSPVVPAVFRWAGRLWLWFFGWQAVGTVPSVPKAVLIAAPHTSNWDLPFSLAVAWALGMRINFVVKASVFRFPFRGFFRWLGGIPVVRDQRASQVERIAQAMGREERIFLLIAPSGTRSQVGHWKSGFMHIARAAGVPILLCFLDFPSKRGGVGPLVTVTGNVRADMDVLRAFYAPVQGKRPENRTEIRLLEEGQGES